MSSKQFDWEKWPETDDQREICEKSLLAYFQYAIKDYKIKQDNINHPAGPWRSDHEFGILLGIRSAVNTLLGSEHWLGLYIQKEIQKLLKKENKNGTSSLCSKMCG
jgi:hypothetical protein